MRDVMTLSLGVRYLFLRVVPLKVLWSGEPTGGPASASSLGLANSYLID